MKADLPTNEALRLKALQDLAILDTPSEDNFDDLVQLAVNICEVPIGLVSLIDKERQWFKSCVGLDVRETSRDLAFCAHAILVPDDLLIVEDATQDPRFADNALVNGPPYIRFYAGAPLVTPEGYALGTLCIIDRKPRQLSSIQINSLKALARQVVQLLRLKSINNIVQDNTSRLESIIEGTNVGTWEWDLASGVVVVNERWAGMLGYRLAELEPVTLETWQTLLHPDDLSLSMAAIQRHLAGESDFYECQFRMRKKDGEWLWVHSHGKLTQRDAQGNPKLLSGMHTDISEIKNTYDRLKEREDLLRSLLSNFPGAAYRREYSGRHAIHYLSAAVQQLTGYSATKFIADQISFSAIIHPEDITRINASVQKALRTKRVFDIEYRIKRADGIWRHVQEIGRGVYGVTGALEFVDGFIWDVQSRYDSEYEKRVITNKISQLFEMAPIGIVQVDAQGYLVEANPEFSKMTGYSEHELKTMTFLELTPKEDWEKSRLAADLLRLTGRVGPFEKNYLTKSGQLIPVEISGSLIQSQDNNDFSWWSLVKDIREQKHIERMKNEFISTVSHELRTPLTSISGALGLLSNGKLGELPAKAKGMLDIAYKNSQRLNLLINDLLDMEKLLAGKMYFDCKPQALLPLVEQAIAENKAYADQYGVKYVVNNTATHALVNIDAFRFQQVLNNFLSNAAKYSPRAGEVEVMLAQIGQKIRIFVRDHGVGIPEEFKSRIFQKFSQADSSDSRQKGGTGLGLAISKELVERMGGNIGFDSQLNQGSCFYAEFPLLEAAVSDNH